MSALSSPAQAQRLVFTGKQKVELQDFELAPPKSGEVLVRTRFSLMSTGTENIVFNRLFDPGTHWDGWVKYPFYPGYCAVGVVEASGNGKWKPGDCTATRLNHQSHGVVSEQNCWPVPAEISLEYAPWFALAKIAFQGARAADYRLGDSVLVIGAGPIGQMSVRWARASGAASIVVVDSVPDRLALARLGGATAVIAAPIEQARDAILDANSGSLPRVVIDSTGNARVFAAALGLADRFGRIVVLGDTGQPGSQALTSDVITRGLTIVGAHDAHNTAQWNDTTIARLFFSLAATGRFSLEGLNTHRFAPRESAKAYETANTDRGKTMGIVFDWGIYS